MDRITFASRLADAAQHAVEFAREHVHEHLPDDVRFRVALNSSYDGNPLHPDERVYPDDRRAHPSERVSRLDIDELVDLLWRDGAVPEWIDFSVEAADQEATIVEVMSCGRFTTNEALLYHQREGRPPFHVLGPALPPESMRDGPGRFSLWWSTAAFDSTSFERAVAHADKVRILALRGRWVDDSVLADVRAFDRLVTLTVEGPSASGEGLTSLEGSTVEHVSLTQVSARRLHLTGLAGLPCLRSIAVAGNPDAVDGLDALAGRTNVDSVTVRVPALTDVGVVARLPSLRDLRLDTSGVSSLAPLARAKSLRHLSLDETPVTDDEMKPVAGLALETISLGHTAITDLGIERLIHNPHLRRLSLVGTAITDASLEALAALPRLDRIDVRQTRVAAAGVAALRKQRSNLQVVADPELGRRRPP